MHTILVHFRSDLPSPDRGVHDGRVTLTVGTTDDRDDLAALLATAKRQAHELREQGYLARIDARWA